MGKKGHEYLIHRVKRPRDGCMGPKEEGEYWEENETHFKKAMWFLTLRPCHS